ncbi:MAG: alpha/beta hydrolase [Chitinophagaceae bacterium]
MKTFLFFIFSLLVVMKLPAQKILPLYDGKIPNSKTMRDEETTENNNGIITISKITKPTLTVFLPPKNITTGAAVVICPGGGYWVVAAKHEGTDVAKKFNEFGVAAFVLKYRIPNDSTMVNKEIGALQDAEQAIKMVRQHAAEWNVDTNRVGIMGFSAGGHLASTEATHFKNVVIENKENINLRPNFLILIYPVVSFQDSIGHIGSRDQLIGKNPSQQKKDEYSNELKITDETPPTFLVHASDDDVVNPQNSIAFYLALLKHHVPAELHIYESGGHGFGMLMKNSKDLWMERCKNWMDANGWLKK